MYIKTERIIYQKAPIPPPICSRRLYRSALATTSLYLFLLCADFPFYRLLHIWCRGSKPLTRCVEECQRPVFHTQGSSCGLIYPFALCSIQWDFSKSLSLDLSKGSPWLLCVPVEPSWFRAELTQRYVSLCLSLSLSGHSRHFPMMWRDRTGSQHTSTSLSRALHYSTGWKWARTEKVLTFNLTQCVWNSIVMIPLHLEVLSKHRKLH